MIFGVLVKISYTVNFSIFEPSKKVEMRYLLKKTPLKGCELTVRERNENKSDKSDVFM